LDGKGNQNSCPPAQLRRKITPPLRNLSAQPQKNDGPRSILVPDVVLKVGKVYISGCFYVGKVYISGEKFVGKCNCC